MKYVITGGAGNISKPLTKHLLSAGHAVTVISRSEANLEELMQLGARPAIGYLEDVEFVKKAFAGADAVYTMCPTNMMVDDLMEFYITLGRNYSQAVEHNNVKYVVNLSSIGAHLEKGAGPVSGMYIVEQALNKLKEVNIRHLRPAYFYYNLFSYIPLIKKAGIIGNNFRTAEKQFPMADITDIATVAAEEMISLNFSDHSFRYIVSEETDTDQIAKLVGQWIGQADLQWITFTDEQALEGLLQAGLPKEISIHFVALGSAINSGKLFEDYWRHHPCPMGTAKLENFMPAFTSAYNSKN
jgi:uncharacterized protein YbjT (DUF2867 family)